MSNRIRGITLLELLVALAIAGIVLSMGLPQWGRWMAERDLRDRADALLHALDRAARPSSAASGWTFVPPPVANARGCRQHGKAAGRSWQHP